ncbi:MAG: hypothetical protein ACYDAC_02105 [Candidatus Dormibacteria bacterium]
MSEAATRREVPGRVVVVTGEPLVLPMSVADGQSSLADQVQDHPWVVALAAAMFAAGLLLMTRRRG